MAHHRATTVRQPRWRYLHSGTGLRYRAAVLGAAPTVLAAGVCRKRSNPARLPLWLQWLFGGAPYL